MLHRIYPSDVGVQVRVNKSAHIAKVLFVAGDWVLTEWPPDPEWDKYKNTSNYQLMNQATYDFEIVSFRKPMRSPNEFS